MANSYPTSLNNYATGASSETLVSAGHASEHNALETKLGTGASTPIANTVLRGTGTGTTAYAQVNLTTDVTGVLPGANGGTGKVTLTQPATGSTLTILDGKTLTIDNSLTLAGTDTTTMTFPSTSDTVVTLGATQTLTNKTLTDTSNHVAETFKSSFANFVQSGLTIPTSASLSATSVAGTIYYNGVAISVASDGGHTYTASNDCYVDVSNAGAYTYNTVANGASAPALTANSIRIAKVVTSGTAVTSVTQSGVDSLGNIIYPNNPSISPTHAMTTYEQITTPANPASGYNKTYFKSDGNLYSLNSSGTETKIGSSGPGSDGWISSSDTLVYASASSFTISGVDRTAVYTKGTRVKFTNNSTTYYGIVISSSFSTNTTVNLAPNNDYSINNSTISSPYYSYEVNPQGYPTIFNYAPTYGASGSMTFSSVTTTTAQFKIDGTMATVYVKAAGTSGGTASYGLHFSLPVTSSNRYSLFGTGLGNTTGSSTQGLAVGNYNYNSTTSGEVCRYDVANWALGSVDFNIGAQYFI